MLSLVEILFSINYLHFKLQYSNNGPVAQRIRHLTTNQGIAGSNPAVVVTNLFHFNLDSSVNLKSQNCGSSCDKSLALSINAVALFSCSHRFIGSYGDAQAR